MTAATTGIELAGIVERAEARVWSDCVAAAPLALAAQLGLAIVPVADGIALVAAGVPSILYNRTFAFGIERPVTEADLDRAIALYDPARPFSIQPTPYTAPVTVRAWLDHRGLVAYFNWVRWVRDVRAAEPPRTALVIEAVNHGGADEYLDLAANIFHEPLEILPWMKHTIGRAGWTHYVARDQSRAVAIAALFVTEGVGWLGWGGTLASHRGRGAQSAMIARRIDDARAAGCSHLTVETADDLPAKPNSSFHNVARAGFRLLYRRPSHAHVPPGRRGAASTE